jgi:hypothetical protein
MAEREIVRTEIGLPAENRRLKNLVASAGEYFLKRQQESFVRQGDDAVFEKAFLETALPIMLKHAQDERARIKTEEQAPRRGQLGQ